MASKHHPVCTTLDMCLARKGKITSHIDPVAQEILIPKVSIHLYQYFCFLNEVSKTALSILKCKKNMGMGKKETGDSTNIWQCNSRLCLVIDVGHKFCNINAFYQDLDGSVKIKCIIMRTLRKQNYTNKFYKQDSGLSMRNTLPPFLANIHEFSRNTINSLYVQNLAQVCRQHFCSNTQQTYPGCT